MKKTLLCGLLLLSGAAFAQKSDNVGIGTIKPDPSAILDLNSTSKGLLLPRMTQAQRDAIKNPAAGLVIFQTDTNIGIYTYDGTTWQPNAKVGGTENISSTQTWSTQGNVIDGSDFIGSTNGQPLKFKVGNTNFGQWDPAQNGSISIGHSAGGNSSIRNVAIGASALSVASGVQGGNLALGYESLKATTVGISNMGIGAWALWKNTEGSFNAAVGAGALYSNITGSKNTAIGTDAMLFGGTATEGNVAIGYQAAYNETGSNKLYISNSSTNTPLIGGDFANNYLKFHTGTANPTATAGYVAIGDFTAAGATNTPGTGAINTFPAFTLTSKYRLIVQDGILTEKLKVALRNGAEWADYVFAPDYKLMSLEDVEKFTLSNKHLPNVPSADEMAKNGLDVTQTSAKLMEKIEELTLYVIELNKRIKELEMKK